MDRSDGQPDELLEIMTSEIVKLRQKLDRLYDSLQALEVLTDAQRHTTAAEPYTWEKIDRTTEGLISLQDAYDTLIRELHYLLPTRMRNIVILINQSVDSYKLAIFKLYDPTADVDGFRTAVKKLHRAIVLAVKHFPHRDTMVDEAIASDLLKVVLWFQLHGLERYCARRKIEVAPEPGEDEVGDPPLSVLAKMAALRKVPPTHDPWLHERMKTRPQSLDGIDWLVVNDPKEGSFYWILEAAEMVLGPASRLGAPIRSMHFVKCLREGALCKALGWVLSPDQLYDEHIGEYLLHVNKWDRAERDLGAPAAYLLQNLGYLDCVKGVSHDILYSVYAGPYYGVVKTGEEKITDEEVHATIDAALHDLVQAGFLSSPTSSSVYCVPLPAMQLHFQLRRLRRFYVTTDDCKRLLDQAGEEIRVKSIFDGIARYLITNFTHLGDEDRVLEALRHAKALGYVVETKWMPVAGLQCSWDVMMLFVGAVVAACQDREGMALITWWHETVEAAHRGVDEFQPRWGTLQEKLRPFLDGPDEPEKKK